MTGHHIPKGVSRDTLQEIIAGWAEVDADEAPEYTSAVEEVTSVSDAVGRQSRFLEEIGVLESHRQQHRLTEAGAQLATALAESDEAKAKAQAAEILDDWSLTEEVRGVLEGNPMDDSELAAVVSGLAEQDPDASRVATGITTLLDLYEWAGVLDRDADGRYRVPGSTSSGGEVESTPGDVEQAAGTSEAARESAPSSDGKETGAAKESGAESGPASELDMNDAESVAALAETLADAAAEADRAAREAREAAAEARSVAQQESETGDESASATQPHTLSLDIDADAEDLEAIVRGIKQGLASQEE